MATISNLKDLSREDLMLEDTNVAKSLPLAAVSIINGEELPPPPPPTVDFEEAIAATKFGKFNILLYLILIPTGWAQVFETTTMSFVFPVAQCDLNLSLEDKGLLNAVTFVGMISSGLVWAYLSDTLGRKKLLVVGYILDALFVVLSSLSQNFQLLVVSKFFGGLIINGPFAALVAYLSEFHGVKNRSRVELLRGIIFNLGNIFLPLLAWIIFPYDINFLLFGDRFVIHSWNVYLFVCAFPSLIGGIAFIFMPESPKFLMSVGRNEEALRVFQLVYSLNTGKMKETYPIKELVDETGFKPKSSKGGNVTAKRSKKLALKEGFQQIKPLCFAPHLRNITLVCIILSFSMISTNTLRLWLPQLFQIISDYEYENNKTASLCTVIETIQPQNSTGDDQFSSSCVFYFSSSVYTNTMIISAICVCGYVIAGTFINKIGKKRILIIFGAISGTSAYYLYFAQNTLAVLIASSIFLAVSGVCRNVIISIVIDLFPTTLRTVAISMMMTVARLSAITGNLLFPVLLMLGCAPPFFTLGTIILLMAILSMCLPKTDRKPLQ